MTTMTPMKPVCERSDEELNRTIVGWMGWICSPREPGQNWDWWYHPEFGIPFFAGDKDACHEAEDKLDAKQRESFALQLWRIVLPDNYDLMRGVVYEEDLFAVVHATARQRAEALVRVIESSKQL